MDGADLYDYEIAEIGRIWKELNQKWMAKQNTRSNLQEFAKDATDAFLQAGFVVNVQWENTLIMVPDISAPGGMRPMPVTIEVLGRAPGIDRRSDMQQGHSLMDHEYKRAEVLQSLERGEAYLGQKDGKRA